MTETEDIECPECGADDVTRTGESAISGLTEVEEDGEVIEVEDYTHLEHFQCQSCTTQWSAEIEVS